MHSQDIFYDLIIKRILIFFFFLTDVLGQATLQGGITCLMESIFVMLVLITCTAGQSPISENYHYHILSILFPQSAP